VAPQTENSENTKDLKATKHNLLQTALEIGPPFLWKKGVDTFNSDLPNIRKPNWPKGFVK